MNQQRHIIGRTILELNTNTLADVCSLQEEASQVFQQQALPKIEQLFNRLVEHDEIVRFDRVVVNLGAIASHNLRDEFPRQVVAELDRILSDRITTLKLQRQMTESMSTSEDEISVQERSRADGEVLLSFLQYGRLPWWCPAGDWQGWFARWEAALQSNTGWRQPMESLLATNLIARRRFVLQLPEGFRQQCLLQLQPGWIEWPSRLTQARRLMQSLDLSEMTRRRLDTQAWTLLLAEIQPGSSVASPLPAATWARNWMAQLVKTWRSRLSRSESASSIIVSAPSQEFPQNQEPIQSAESASPLISDSSPIVPKAKISFEEIAAQRLLAVIKTFSSSEQNLWLGAISTAIPSQPNQPPVTKSRLSSDNVSPQFTGSLSTSEDREERYRSDWEILLFFLQYGRLPRWCSAGDWQDWLPRWEAILQSNTAWRQPLQILLITNLTARQRFIKQLPEGFRQQCLLQLQPGWIEWTFRLTQARRLMQSLDLSEKTKHRLDTQAWVLLLAEIQPGISVASPLPAATWARNWMEQLLQTLRSQLSSSESASDTIVSATRQDSSLNQEPIQNAESGSALTSESFPIVPKAKISFEDIAAQRLQAVIKTFSSSEQNLWLGAISTAIPSQPNQLPTSRLSSENVSSPAKTPIAESIESEAEGRLSPEDSLAPDTNPLDSSSDDLQEDSIEIRNALKATSIQNSIEQTTNISDLFPANNLQEEGMELSVYNEAVEPLEDLVEPDLMSSESVSLSSENSQDAVLYSPKQTDRSELSPELLALLKGDKRQSISTPKTSRSSLSSEEERAGIYITQAGLVLLHPFIQPYLDKIGLLNDASFRDDIAQQQAIYLLYYLATGQTRAPEPELVLPKLLCGWPLNDPIELDLELPEAALTEGEHLLQTAITHWEALKSTSPDGLREGFLQREGKLSCTDNGWKLQVERKAIDILLSSLPWGVSMVTLPWMEDLLTVEWM